MKIAKCCAAALFALAAASASATVVKQQTCDATNPTLTTTCIGQVVKQDFGLPVHRVPEPGTWALVALGLAGLLLTHRQRPARSAVHEKS